MREKGEGGEERLKLRAGPQVGGVVFEQARRHLSASTPSISTFKLTSRVEPPCSARASTWKDPSLASEHACSTRNFSMSATVAGGTSTTSQTRRVMP